MCYLTRTTRQLTTLRTWLLDRRWYSHDIIVSIEIDLPEGAWHPFYDKVIPTMTHEPAFIPRTALASARFQGEPISINRWLVREGLAINFEPYAERIRKHLNFARVMPSTPAISLSTLVLTLRRATASF